MLSLIGLAIFVYVVRKMYRSHKKAKIEHLYLNGLLANEVFTPEQHANVKRWIEELE